MAVFAFVAAVWFMCLQLYNVNYLLFECWKCAVTIKVPSFHFRPLFWCLHLQMSLIGICLFFVRDKITYQITLAQVFIKLNKKNNSSGSKRYYLKDAKLTLKVSQREQIASSHIHQLRPQDCYPSLPAFWIIHWL